jgi:hypothetical protein
MVERPGSIADAEAAEGIAASASAHEAAIT